MVICMDWAKNYSRQLQLRWQSGRLSHQVLLAGVVALLQSLEPVAVARAAFVDEPLAPLRLHVEVEHRLRGAAPSGVFGQSTNVLCSVTERHQRQRRQRRDGQRHRRRRRGRKTLHCDHNCQKNFFDCKPKKPPQDVSGLTPSHLILK